MAAQDGNPAIAAVPAETAEQFATVVRKFREFCVLRKNVIYERYVFHTRQQQEEEVVDSFVMDLRLKSQTCEFGPLMDSLIRDRLVVGIQDAKLKEKLLRDPKLTLERAIEVCKISEAAQAQMKVLTRAVSHGEGSPKTSVNVNVVKTTSASRKGKKLNPADAQSNSHHQSNSSSQVQDTKTTKSKKSLWTCRRCEIHTSGVIARPGYKLANGVVDQIILLTCVKPGLYS